MQVNGRVEHMRRDQLGVEAFPLISPPTPRSEETVGASKSMCNKAHTLHYPTQAASREFLCGSCLVSAVAVSLHAAEISGP